jgi:hypothetical protein
LALDTSERKADMESAGSWSSINGRAEEILDDCGIAEKSPYLEDGESKERDRRSLLRPLAREIATMENDLRRCTRRDTRYFALLKAYEGALATLKKM